MLASSVVLALAALLPGLVSAGPIQKRYTNSLIRSYRTNTCLTLQGGVQVIDGSLLSVGDCATATRWDIQPGSGSVTVSGLDFALDAGTNPHNNVPAKVWTSYPGLEQQTWYLTGDNRIAITNGTQCLDEGDNGPQTYQCTTGNTNQIWYVDTSSSGSATTTILGATPSSTSSSPASSATGASAQIKWVVNENLCATVLGDTVNGSPVTMQNCFNPTSPSGANQLFYVNQGGLIQYAGTNFCLDAGINPNNGVSLKIWQCYQNLAQQTWTVNGNLISTANNQCLDIDNSNLSNLQTWLCSNPDPQQQFKVVG